MNEIDFQQFELKNRKDFLSVDKQTAISSEGMFFNIDDKVKHESAGEQVATIESFSLNEETMDVIAQTNLGTARISFLYKN